MKRLFNKKDTAIGGSVIVDGVIMYCDIDIARYVRKLEEENYELRKDKDKLKLELETIKPALKTVDLKHAVSKYCSQCKYAVMSRWNNDVIGCCKDCVCEDFAGKEKEND